MSTNQGVRKHRLQAFDPFSLSDGEGGGLSRNIRMLHPQLKHVSYYNQRSRKTGAKTVLCQNSLCNVYTVNHKKRDILFLTITLANLNRFL